jgi:hypothetical protein
MPRLKSPRTRASSPRDGDDLTLAEALLRCNDPRTSEWLSVFYAHLARAQANGDEEGIAYLRQAIAEAMRGEPAGEIDEPLLPLRRHRPQRRGRVSNSR